MLSANIFGSKVASDAYGSKMVITDKYFNSYTHTISAFGGYDTSTLSILIRKEKMDDFLFNVLGSSIKIYTSESESIWEGFINEIVLTYNNNDITVGPLMEISNKVLVRYSDFITGTPGVTTYANNILSQERYGTFTRIVVGVSVSPENADNIRDNYLQDNKFPAYNFNLTLQPSGDFLQVTLNCLGFYHLLGTYVYNNPSTDITTPYTVRDKILDILRAHPTGLFNRFGLIDPNSLSVLRLEDQDRLAIDIIKELVNLGSDVNNNRMTFSIYNDLSILYREIPTEVRYFYRNTGNSRDIFNRQHGKVNIATIKAGEYIAIEDVPDFMPGGLKSIPKYIFAENISYTAPFGLSITGTNVSTLSQRLAKLGLSGLS